MNMVLVRAGSLPYRSRMLPLQRAETIPPVRNLRDAGTAIGAERTEIVLPASATSLATGPVSQGELEFWLERQAFDLIPPNQLTQYEGVFVASRNGQIVDSDAALERLTERFFNRFGDVPVYMTRIGSEPEIQIDTPFFD